MTRRVELGEVARYASTPLLDADVPVLVPLETLAGRDSYEFSEGEEPPWRGRVRKRLPRTAAPAEAHHQASWCSMTPMPELELDAAGERAGERSERLAVGVADEELVLACARSASARKRGCGRR